MDKNKFNKLKDDLSLAFASNGEINLNKKIGNVKDVIAYNTMLSFEDKLTILENLILLCYETNFIRESIKEAQEDRNEIKKCV